MKIGNPKSIINPYEWLPCDGESGVSFRPDGVDMIIEVDYAKNRPTSDDEEVLIYRKEIRFKAANYFLKTPFPGTSVFFDYDVNSKKPNLGHLTEYQNSEFAQNCIKTQKSLYAGYPSNMRHFSIQFLSENIAFHVLAEDVFLSDEFIVA